MREGRETASNRSGRRGGWAVVDVETTGLHPVDDRVVEIAIIRLDNDARPVDEWSTLIDPKLATLGSRIHGIRLAELRGAPTFKDILPELLARLSDRVVVAHNAAFDVGFLQAETIRAGIAWGPVEGFCTMEVLHKLALSKSRKLHLSCEELGVPAGREHIALDDARMVAGIMSMLGPRLWALDRPRAAPSWPEPPVHVALHPRPAVEAVPPNDGGVRALADYVRLPADLGVTSAAASTYLALLDHVVEDGVVTDAEVDALSLFAHATGVTREIARRLHLEYLTGMERLFQADGVVTDAESKRLRTLYPLLSRALPR